MRGGGESCFFMLWRRIMFFYVVEENHVFYVVEENHVFYVVFFRKMMNKNKDL